jgi:hypothetical protein
MISPDKSAVLKKSVKPFLSSSVTPSRFSAPSMVSVRKNSIYSGSTPLNNSLFLSINFLISSLTSGKSFFTPRTAFQKSTPHPFNPFSESHCTAYEIVL